MMKTCMKIDGRPLGPKTKTSLMHAYIIYYSHQKYSD